MIIDLIKFMLKNDNLLYVTINVIYLVHEGDRRDKLDSDYILANQIGQFGWKQVKDDYLLSNVSQTWFRYWVVYFFNAYRFK